MAKAGWWRDPEALRKTSVDRILSPLREKAAEAAREAAEIRIARNIIDPDPDNSSAVISSADRHIIEIDQRLRKQRQRVTQVEDQFQRLLKMHPEEMGEALRVTQIEDNTMRKVVAALQDAVVEATRLKASGVGEKHPRLAAVNSQIEVFKQTLADAMTSIKQNVAALREVEKRTLEKVEGEFETASKAQIEDKVHVTEYLKAKTQYLRSKKVYEAAQIKYEIEDLEHLERLNPSDLR
jgi:hypothetical protein